MNLNGINGWYSYDILLDVNLVPSCYPAVLRTHVGDITLKTESGIIFEVGVPALVIAGA